MPNLIQSTRTYLFDSSTISIWLKRLEWNMLRTLRRQFELPSVSPLTAATPLPPCVTPLLQPLLFLPARLALLPVTSPDPATPLPPPVTPLQPLLRFLLVNEAVEVVAGKFGGSQLWRSLSSMQSGPLWWTGGANRGHVRSRVSQFYCALPTAQSTAVAELENLKLRSGSTVSECSDAGAVPSAVPQDVCFYEIWSTEPSPNHSEHPKAMPNLIQSTRTYPFDSLTISRFDGEGSSEDWGEEFCLGAGEGDGEGHDEEEREEEGECTEMEEESFDEGEAAVKRKGRRGQREGYQQTDPSKPPLLLVIQPRLTPTSRLKVKLAEALRLADSLRGPDADERGRGREAERVRGGAGGEQPGWEGEEGGVWQAGMEAGKGLPYVVVQLPESRGGSVSTYFKEGTVSKVGVHLRAVEASGCTVDALFVNAKLSGIQQRSLEEAWGKPVLDRVAVIIKIFGMHARTREAKLQVELAALEVKSSRLVRTRGQQGKRGTFWGGSAEVVSARGRASARGQGFVGGAGETELNLQRRRILTRRLQLQGMLESVRRTRELHRRGRKRAGECGRLKGGGHLPVVAVVGYTNAGKSSIVSSLSRRSTYCDDRLFATLDPQLCPVMLPSGRRVLLSDTVGFISDLPIELVEAFSATLEEVKEADLLLHVIDSSAENALEQRRVVMQVLRGMGVSEEFLATRTVEAWNKVDLVNAGGNRTDAGERGVETSERSELEDSKERDEELDASEKWESTWDFCASQEHLVTPGSVRVCTSVVKGHGMRTLLSLIDKKLPEHPMKRSLWISRHRN